jgi:hypothetical protein
MANSYSINWRTWQWTNKLLFHLLDLTILNSYIILTSYGSQINNWKFCLTLVQDLLEMTAREPQPQSSPSQTNDLSWSSTHQTLASCSIVLVGAVCAQWRRKVWLQNFHAWSAKLACVQTRVFVFSIQKQTSKSTLYYNVGRTFTKI